MCCASVVDETIPAENSIIQAEEVSISQQGRPMESQMAQNSADQIIQDNNGSLLLQSELGDIKSTPKSETPVKLELQIRCDKKVLIIDQFPKEIFLERVISDQKVPLNNFYYQGMSDLVKVEQETPALPTSDETRTRFDEILVKIEGDQCYIDTVTIGVSSGCGDDKIVGFDAYREKTIQLQAERVKEHNVLEYITEGIHNAPNNGTGPEVPSIKRCKIEIAYHATCETSEPLRTITICIDQVYIVWRKLISRIYERARLHDGKFDNFGNVSREEEYERLFRVNSPGTPETGTPETDTLETDTPETDTPETGTSETDTPEKGAPKEENFNEGDHLFYYRFTYPYVSKGFEWNLMCITIHKDEPYHIAIAEKFRQSSPSSYINGQKAHSSFLDKLEPSLQQASKIYVNIDHFVNAIKQPGAFTLPVVFDGAWVVRFQRDRQMISPHCYGIAADYNTFNYFNDMVMDRWNEILMVLEKLYYDKMEIDHITDKKHYYFTFLGNAGKEYDNNKKDWFYMKDGGAFMNFLLYHLAFKNNLYWGAYFKPNTDAMHFSLLEDDTPAKPEPSYAIPPSILNTRRIEYFDGSIKLLTAYFSSTYACYTREFTIWEPWKFYIDSKTNLRFSHWYVTYENDISTKIYPGDKLRCLDNSNNGLGSIEIEIEISTVVKGKVSRRKEWKIMAASNLRLYAHWMQ